MSTASMATAYPVRGAMVPVARTLRAYFAPVARTTETPAIFDPAVHGAFALEAPPAPWLSLGWVEGFSRAAATKLQVVAAGSKGAPGSTFRDALASLVEFDFREWGKLQMALAGGSQHMNVLAANTTSTPQPSGATPIAAVALLAGSTASKLVVGAGALGGFNVGDLLAVDADYAQQTGYVGTGIAAAYVKQSSDVRNDANYVRRVTFNVGRVVSKTVDSLVLGQPLLGGSPAANASVQKVAAFVDREGGSFFQEWSALFVWPEEAGGRICLYYPRLTPRALAGAGGNAGAGANAPEVATDVMPPLSARGLHASFLALPYTDINDNETVVCYRSYFPSSSASVY